MRYFSVFSKIVMLCGIAISLSAQSTYTPELLWKLRRITEFQVSPDGQSIVYGVRSFDLKNNSGNTDLYLIPVAGGEAVKLTDTPESEFNPRWTADSKRIGFLKAKDGVVQLFEMDKSGAGMRQVSQWQKGADGFEYSPKGNYILFSGRVKLGKTAKDMYPDLPLATGEVYDELMFRHWNQWSDGTYNHLFIQKLQEGSTVGQAIDLLENEPYHAPLMPHGGLEQTSWSPDESRIAYACKKLKGTESAQSTNTDIYVYTLETGKTLNLTPDNKGYDTEPRFSPDGTKLIWTAMKTPGYEADKNRLMLHSFGDNYSVDLTSDYDVTLSHPVWSPDGNIIYAQIPANGTEQIFRINFKAQSKDDKMRLFTQGQFNYGSFQPVAGSSVENLIGMRMSMKDAPELYRIEGANARQAKLTQVNDDILKNVKTGNVEKRMVKTTDGKDMLVWVIYPPDFDPNKKYPALLYCQGGPQSQVSQFFSYRWNFQMMAAAGYIIIAPNRRGLPGFGQKWNDDIGEDWGGQAFRDYLSATDSISKLPFVDANRLGAVGASYGGYSVYWLAGNHNGRFKSFISHCGVFNLESMYGSTEEIFFTEREMGGAYWEEPQPKSYSAFSPHKFLKNWNTPILVIHGDKDFRVPVNEGIQAFTAAQIKQIPSRFLWFPDEGHWVMKPQNSVLWSRVFIDWLNQTLQ
jgi:dipeptidyl aminopeptidase/acylaminoacyl peptidase